jgi:AcrR family transcriptional regulator
VHHDREPGAAARQAMIEVAERLYAERGINGVSLREIGAAAGQRNTAAARYHFGTKQGLVDAVFERRMVPINARRLALLDELDAEGRGHDLPGLAEAFLLPLAEELGEVGRPSFYLRFATQAGYVDGAAPTDLARQSWTRGILEVRDRFDDVLAAAGLPDEIRADRWTLFSGHFAHALAGRELLQQEGRLAGLSDRGVFLAGLLDTGVALAAAPLSDRTRSLLATAHRRRA